MGAKGLLVDYEWCSGCHTCEVACQLEHGYPSDQWGIKVHEVGPWEYAPKTWQYSYLPAPTDQCDLCAERTAKGKKPLCVKHCQSLAMRYGPVDELVRNFDGSTKFAVFVPKAGTVC